MDSIKEQAINPCMLRAIRKKLGISQEEMAKKLGCHQAAISRIERGTETPEWLLKFAVLSKMASEASFSWEDIIMDNPPPTLRTAEKPAKYNA